MRKPTKTYTELFMRLCKAASRLEPRKAMLCGMWFQRWEERQDWGY